MVIRYPGILLLFLTAIVLTSCYDPGELKFTCDPPPNISSSPPTSATAGYQYRYYTDASYVCGMILPAICNNIVGLQLPAGATIDQFYDSVTWTPGANDANKNVPFKIATETDACGKRSSQSWTVHVHPAPVIESFAAAKIGLNSGEATSLTAIFQGTGYIDGIGPVTSGTPIATPSLNFTTNFTLSVTNEAGIKVQQTLTVRVLQPPVINSFTASNSVLTDGDTILLDWSASGDFSSAILEPGGIEVMNQTRMYITPWETTTYVLRLFNEAGASDSASVQVTVVPPPVISSFTASPDASVLRGNVSLAPVFHNGSGEIQRDDVSEVVSLGPVVSGVSLDSGQLLRSTAFHLVVRNAAGTSVTQKIVVPLTGPGTFQPTAGQPITTRDSHSATRLADGRVFIAGGTNSSGSLASTEIFNPSTGAFTAGPNLLEPRHSHSAALLPDGRVLLIGGYSTNSFRILTAEIYDPASETISSAGRLPVSDLVTPQAVPLTDGRVLVVHPSLGQGSEVFDSAENAFTPVGPLQTGHSCIRLARLADGRILVIDGNDPSEIFSPGPDTFSLTGALKYGGRCRFSAAALSNGRVLVAGGSSSVTAELYDPATGLFSDAGEQQYPATENAAVELPNGKVLVVGGLWRGWRSPWAELFDPAAGQFTLTGSCENGRRLHTATLLDNGQVLVSGGCGSAPCAELYTPEEDGEGVNFAPAQ
jgi:hypothetical protein